MTTARYATALTGGAAGALDAKARATLSDGDIAWVATGTTLYVYKFVAAATDAENVPSRIRPDDYSTGGVWYIQNVSADYSQMVRDSVSGGNATVSGQVVTFGATSCWDSTRTTWLETLVNKTVTLGTTNSQMYHIYMVKLVADSSVEFRAYTTEAGVTSDAQISHYLYMTPWQNNSSGAAKAGVLISDGANAELWYLKASEAAVNSAGTVPAGINTSLSLAAFLPASTRVIGVAMGASGSTSAQSLSFSTDGVNAFFGFASGSSLTGDADTGAWGVYNQPVFIPISGNAIYWGRGADGAAGSHKALLHAIRFRRR